MDLWIAVDQLTKACDKTLEGFLDDPNFRAKTPKSPAKPCAEKSDIRLTSIIQSNFLSRYSKWILSRIFLDQRKTSLLDPRRSHPDDNPHRRYNEHTESWLISHQSLLHSVEEEDYKELD